MYRKTQIERRELMNWRSLGEKIKSGKGGIEKKNRSLQLLEKIIRTERSAPPQKKNTNEWTVGEKKRY